MGNFLIIETGRDVQWVKLHWSYTGDIVTSNANICGLSAKCFGWKLVSCPRNSSQMPLLAISVVYLDSIKAAIIITDYPYAMSSSGDSNIELRLNSFYFC